MFPVLIDLVLFLLQSIKNLSRHDMKAQALRIRVTIGGLIGLLAPLPRFQFGAVVERD